MAKRKRDLGSVIGPAGKDANIASATGIVNPGHLDEPTVDVSVGGTPGENTLDFTFNGLQGNDGRDASLEAVNVTVDDTHLDTPEAESQLIGEPGDQTLQINFKGLVGAPAGFGEITVSIIDTEDGKPSVEASWSGLDTSKDLNLVFHNIKGDKGDKGETGDKGDRGDPYTPEGTANQIILGDGTIQDISEFIKNNIETIRSELGLATIDHAGLLPQLPPIDDLVE